MNYPITDYILVFLGMNTFLLFILNRELLNQKRSFRILLSIDIILLFVYYLIPDVKSVFTFKGSLIQLLLYRFEHYAFVKVNRREPQNTFWTFSWKKGLWKDILFNFLFIVSLLLVIVLSSVI